MSLVHAGAIPCRMCLGDGRDHSPGGNLPKCGGCGGTGLSREPYDLMRNASTVGVSSASVFKAAPHLPQNKYGLTAASKADLRAAVEIEHPTLTEVEVHSVGLVAHDGGSVSGVLISWRNPEYDARLAAHKAGKLYAVGYWEGVK